MEYAALRKRMVEEQIVGRGIKDARVISAFNKVPRHVFVPEAERERSYADTPLPIGEGQTISQPYIVALMTECLGLTGKEKILEIGTGSGYQAAILAELAKDVFSIERKEKIAAAAKENLLQAGYCSVHLRISDGTLGWPEEAPFEAIIITAANPEVPLPLIEQLKENGLLIAPLGNCGSQVLTVARKKNGSLESMNVCGCVFVPLIGKYGAKERTY